MDTVLGITVSKRNPFEQLYACVCRYLSPSAISLVIAGLQAGPEISNNSPFCVLAKQFRRQTPLHLKNVHQGIAWNFSTAVPRVYYGHSIAFRQDSFLETECSVSASDSGKINRRKGLD